MVDAAFRGRAPVDVVCRDYLRQHKQLGSRDKAWVNAVVWDLVRHRRWYEHVAGRIGDDGTDALDLVLTRVLDTGEVDDDDVPAPAGRIRRARQRLDAAGARPHPVDVASLALSASFPDWLVDSWVDALGLDDAIRLTRALNERAPLSLRANTLRATRQQVIARLGDEGIQSSAGSHAPHAIAVDGRASWGASATFRDGWFEVQDEGSQLIAALCEAQPGQTVVDACAGGGGKTLALAADMQGRGTLYAFDDNERRLSKLRPRARRADAHNIRTDVVSGGADRRITRLRGKVYCVLIDAPCSGLGTLRRSPDAWWRIDDAWLDELTSIQRSLLDQYAAVPRVGGRIVYATCSTLARENEDQVRAFLERHDGWRLEHAGEVLARTGAPVEGMGEMMRLWPHRHGTDGFFAAVLVRER